MMDMKFFFHSIWSLLCMFLVSVNAFSERSFPWDIANTSVYLAASAYCPTSTYLHRTYRGAGTGFIAYEVIDMKQKRNIDVQVSQ
jgi:hypothetical protein